ncbi:MAG: hypothetical protein EOP83_25390 [Verrucomicrobiaceae bacterium]|nr:MAG: hypothetical protein EOP83_25390 [Verrucomicrobiaceae bacterium]
MSKDETTRAQTVGFCARAISGRHDRSSARYKIIPIIPNPTEVARHTKRTQRVPEHWPVEISYPACHAVYALAEAMRAPDFEQDWDLSRPALKKATALAAIVANALAIESFALVCDRDNIPQAIHSVGMHRGDHEGSYHVLKKAWRPFMDLPAYEQGYVWKDVREGGLLTERERDGITMGSEFSGFINPESSFAHLGRVVPPRPVVSPPPNPISKKAEVDDPGLIAAIERLRLAAGF